MERRLSPRDMYIDNLIGLEQWVSYLIPPALKLPNFNFLDTTIKISYLRLKLITYCNQLLLWLRQKMCHVHPPLWNFFRLMENINCTRDLRRNLCIWWLLYTPFHDIIFMYIRPFCQVNIYFLLRGQICLSRITSPKSFFQNFRLFLIQLGEIFPKVQLKVIALCKNLLYLVSVSNNFHIP